MKRRKILTVSVLCALFAVISGFAVQGHSRAAQYQRLLENNYLHACRELVTAVSELDKTLQKARYTATPPLMDSLCTQLACQAAAAQMALSALPNSGAELEQTGAFLARVGDYARALARKNAAQNGCCPQDRETLAALSDICTRLSSGLLAVQNNSDFTAHALPALLSLDTALKDGQAAPGGTDFQTVEADFPETASLIYDGPFSSHLDNRPALALQGLPQTSQADALSAAAAFLSLPTQALTAAGEGEGVLPTWSFSAVADGRELYLEVTKQGGKALRLLCSHRAGTAVYSAPQGVEIARTFLTEHGFAPVRESYYIDQSGVLTVNFAALEGDVICYPDLVKVSVALDIGEVVGFECHGWLTNHTARQLPAPTVDRTQAQQTIAEELTVLSHQLALIPTAGQYEVLCHEFKCLTPDKKHIIVYVNGETGNEEQILLLLEDRSGTLVR